MNLFDLSVKIGVVDEASEKIPAIGDKLKTGLGAAGKVAAAGVAAATTAVAALTKTAIEGYANYEQLAGGVETLFKTSSAEVMKYAENAYKSAGLSANEYMETVTSFSASLISSLDGDTAEAAKYADRAIISMSDNANKMGTDISMIQNAYQGFAKQNYTMLDNLKLGYGGTQTEMQRLIADAAEMKDIQEQLGITVDASSMSFDNIVNAIQVMQTSMGIAGATAAEAEGTISGSVDSMKAAWQNLAVGLGDNTADMSDLFNKFLESVGTVATNVIPVVETILTNIGQTLLDNGPEMLAKGVVLLSKFALGIVQTIPTVVSKIPELITAIVEEFEENGPDIIQIGEDIVRGIWEGIKNLVEWLKEKIGGFVGGIVDNIKSLLGIHSPSRVFAGIGENMALGLGNGWEDQYGIVRRQVVSDLDFGTGTVSFSNSGLGTSSAGIINASATGNRVVSGFSGPVELVLKSDDGQTFGRWMVPFIRSENKSNPEVVSDSL